MGHDLHAGVRLVNLTPHPVVVAGPGGRVELPSAGVARVVDHERASTRLGGMDVVEVQFGDVQGLPDPAPGVLLVVSRVVALALPGRSDLLFPYGELRDAAGRIEAVRALARVARDPGGSDDFGLG
jgi:hypothetical protein